MSEYSDTNVGMGHAYDSPEDKEIERLEQKLKTRDSELAQLRAEVTKLKEGEQILWSQLSERDEVNAQQRSTATARIAEKCVELQADNLRLHRLLAQFTGNA